MDLFGDDLEALGSNLATLPGRGGESDLPGRSTVQAHLAIRCDLRVVSYCSRILLYAARQPLTEACHHYRP